ncbi:MAG: hypothetical protein Kow0037_31240 [Calditrichia bacterium]
MVFTPSPGTGDLIDVDPFFSDTTNLDFRLQPNSPAIGSGLNGYDRGALPFEVRPAPVHQLDLNISGDDTICELSWQNPLLYTDSTQITGYLTARVYRNDALLKEFLNVQPGENLAIADTIFSSGNNRYAVTVHDGNREGLPRATARFWAGGALRGIVVWNLDPNPVSANRLQSALNQLAYPEPVFITSDPHEYDLSAQVRAVFVLLGIEPNDFLLGEGASNRLINYLSSGGNVYLEGGDFWSDPNQQLLAVSQYFHIQSLSGGQGDLTQVSGVPMTFTEGLFFNYVGENQSIDDIVNQSDSETILYNPADNNGCAVAYNSGSYKTIGASFQLGGLADGAYPNTATEYIRRVLEFFDALTITPKTPAGITAHFALLGNYPNPFNAQTRIRFRVGQSGWVRLQIFNVAGQQVGRFRQFVNSPGENEFVVAAESLPSGVYFYRLAVESERGAVNTPAHKMILIK